MARRRRITKKEIAPTAKITAGAFPKIVLIALCLIPAAATFITGKYIEFNSPDPFDSGAYVYSARHLLEGARLGVDEFPSAKPGTLLANIIGVKLFGFGETGPLIVQMLLQITALVFMFYVLYKAFGPPAAVIGITIAAVYLSAPVIAKFGNAKEQFMIPFMIAAAGCLILHEITQKKNWMILSGLFVVQPYFCKPTGVSVMAAVALYILLKYTPAKKWKQLAQTLILFTTGYILGLLVPASLYIWQRQPLTILKTFPVVALQTAFLFLVMGVGVFYTLPFIRQYHPLRILRSVSKWIGLTGAVALIVSLIFSILLIRKQPGSIPEDVGSYIHTIPFIAWADSILYWITLPVHKVLAAGGIGSGYAASGWASAQFSQVAPQILRYYKVLAVPILLALTSIAWAAAVWIQNLRKKTIPDTVQSRIVWLLAVWWILDMAFVWVSPRSYEQYYLPLCASAAMLSGYTLWQWNQKRKTAPNPLAWAFGGLLIIGLLAGLSLPIFIGQRYSPDLGKRLDYIEQYGHRRRGFGPALDELPTRKQGPWIEIADYIRIHSTEQDTLYVWGWVPGIYVQAQRLAPVPKAFESDMHLMSPKQLEVNMKAIVRTMKQKPPKFIVDSRKIHFPNDRPPLELWPHTYTREKPTGEPIPNNPQAVAQYDTLYKKLLSEEFDPAQKQYNALPGLTSWLRYAPWTKEMPDEAQRYEAMKPLRDFVMNNYRIAGYFGYHVLFEYPPGS